MLLLREMRSGGNEDALLGCFVVLVGQVHWAAYCLLLSVFHFLEFFVTALYQPADVSYECA
jgi:hypothetical protein